MTKTLHRKTSDWLGTFAEWIEGDHAYISVVFSWEVQKVYMRAAALRQEGYHVHVGGPAAMMQWHVFSGISNGMSHIPALRRHNPNATFTSRGCIRKCEFCVVPKVEGDLWELPHWDPKPIVCDNNLLACSKEHFDKVVDSLKPIPGIDFNQGLDARLLRKYHAERLAELDLAFVRFAWDDVKHERSIHRAYDLLRGAGIPKSKIRVYVMIGYKDTPDDALYRLTELRELGIMPNPMRYQPLLATERDQYVDEHWTEEELTRYMRYWANLAYAGGIPFEEFA